MDNVRDEKLCGDLNVATAAVRQNMFAREFAWFKDVVAAIAAFEKLDCPWGLEHVAPELRNNKLVVLAALTGSFQAEVIRCDEAPDPNEAVPEMMHRLQKTKGRQLYHASEELQADIEVVLSAVLIDPAAVWAASRELQTNPRVLRVARKENCLARIQQWLHELRDDEKLRGDLEDVTAVVKEFEKLDCPWGLEHVAPELRNNKLVVLAALTGSFQAEVIRCGEALNPNEAVCEMMHRLRKTKGGQLSYASEELQADIEVVLTAVVINPAAVRNASEELQQDQRVLRVAGQGNVLARMQQWLQEVRHLQLQK